MRNRPTVNSCRQCGATCYRRVIARNSDGAMRPTGRYRCTGCSLSFVDPKEWRGAGTEAHVAIATAQVQGSLEPWG